MRGRLHVADYRVGTGDGPNIRVAASRLKAGGAISASTGS